MDNFEVGLGRHYLIELYECHSGNLNDPTLIEEVLLEACKMSGATIINSTFHQFAPQGVSGVIVIAESHFSIHTWPEKNYAALDFFTCSPNMNVEKAINYIEEKLQSDHSEIKEVIRGEAIESFAEVVE